MLYKHHIHYTKIALYLLLFVGVISCTAEPRDLGSDKRRMNNVTNSAEAQTLVTTARERWLTHGASAEVRDVPVEVFLLGEEDGYLILPEAFDVRHVEVVQQRWNFLLTLNPTKLPVLNYEVDSFSDTHYLHSTACWTHQNGNSWLDQCQRTYSSDTPHAAGEVWTFTQFAVANGANSVRDVEAGVGFDVEKAKLLNWDPGSDIEMDYCREMTLLDINSLREKHLVCGSDITLNSPEGYFANSWHGNSDEPMMTAMGIEIEMETDEPPVWWVDGRYEIGR